MAVTIIQASNPKTLKRQIAEARRLRAKGVEVVVFIDDLDNMCKFHDPDTIADLLDGVPLEETNQIAGD